VLYGIVFKHFTKEMSMYIDDEVVLEEVQAQFA